MSGARRRSRAFNRRRLPLVLHLDLHVLAGELEFLDDGGEVVFEAEVEVWLQQREVHVLREPPHVVQKPETSAAVECRFLEKSSARKPCKCDLLHDFMLDVVFHYIRLLLHVVYHLVEQCHLKSLSAALKRAALCPHAAYSANICGSWFAKESKSKRTSSSRYDARVFGE